MTCDVTAISENHSLSYTTVTLSRLYPSYGDAFVWTASGAISAKVK